MLQLHNLPTTTEGRLCRATARRDGAALVWDLDVAFDMHDEDDAEAVEPFVPGTVAVWCSGQEGGRGTVKVTGGFDLAHVAFSRDGERLATGHAEVRSCAVTVAAEQSTLVVRLRVHGLLPRPAAALVYELDEVLEVHMDSRQLGLFQAPGGAGGTQDGPGADQEAQEALEALPGAAEGCDLVGRLVVVPDGDDQLAGICTVAGRDDLTIHTLEAGAVEVPRPRELVAVLEVVPPEDTDLDELLDAYQAAMVQLRGVPSWHYIVTAIGELYAEGHLAARDDFAWQLSPAVVTRALEVGTRTEGP